MAYHTTPHLAPADVALLSTYIDLPSAPPIPETLCCDGLRRGVFAASVNDPTCCVRCVTARRAEALAARYAWRVVSFGRIRRVPAHEAQRWP